MAKTYHLECGAGCSLGPATKWGPRVSDALVEGISYRDIVKMAADEGDKMFPGTISRHKRHIVITASSEEVPGDLRYKANNIEILETIIQKGFQNAKNWKPTISDTMKAMDMWFRLTQGNPFDDLLDTLAAAAIGEEMPEGENPNAVHVVGEVSTPMFEDESEELVESASA